MHVQYDEKVLTCCSTATEHLTTSRRYALQCVIFKLLCFQKIGERDYFVTHS